MCCRSPRMRVSRWPTRRAGSHTQFTSAIGDAGAARQVPCARGQRPRNPRRSGARRGSRHCSFVGRRGASDVHRAARQCARCRGRRVRLDERARHRSRLHGRWRDARTCRIAGKAGVVMKGEGKASRDASSAENRWTSCSRLIRPWSAPSAGRRAGGNACRAEERRRAALGARTFDASGEPGKGLTVGAIQRRCRISRGGHAPANRRAPRVRRPCGWRWPTTRSRTRCSRGARTSKRKASARPQRRRTTTPARARCACRDPGGAPRVTNPDIEIEAELDRRDARGPAHGGER